ncbi:MAG: aquaporin [Acidobacteriota bacterium]|nr:aquaporin [Acidobacteriota bacterium]
MRLLKACLAEAWGTALLVAIGVSIVIVASASSGPVVPLVPDAGLRRLITGFLFGATGALVTVSGVGRASGAHINPAVTLAFWLRRRMPASHALAYVAAQCAGAALGGAALLAWGRTGTTVAFGATLPGRAFGPGLALAGEAVTTATLVILLFAFLGRRRLRAWTPLLFPPLYAVMVYLEAPISGTSTNPARSLGSALAAGAWQSWWVYWIGPALGVLIAWGVHRLGGLRDLEIEVAKVYHFDHDPSGLFADMAQAGRRVAREERGRP